MCELFAMSSSIPTEVSFSLDEFSKHGGLTDQHKDGWGIAYYEDNDARIIKEASTASESAYLNFVKDHSIQSKTIISHIRQATQGEVSIRNTQPFSRELGGRQHVFAHNGDLFNFNKMPNLSLNRFRPIGNTDSELAFCYLMENMAKIWDQKTPPELIARHNVITTFAKELRELGIANFIYSDSDYIFIHSDKRISQNKNKEQLPGLHIICRSCHVDDSNRSIVGLRLRGMKSKDVVLVASVPLSSNNWVALKEGEVNVLQNGKIIKVP